MRRTKTAKIGDYVLTTKFSDAMWGDPWAVGYICKIIVYIKNCKISDPRYVVCDAVTGEIRSPYADGLRCVWKITDEEGENIIHNSKCFPSYNMKIYGKERF